MKFACGRCWDYDCYCTEEELMEHRLKNKLDAYNRRKKESLELVDKYMNDMKNKLYCETISLNEWIMKNK